MAKSPAYWAVWGLAYRDRLPVHQRQTSAVAQAQLPREWLNGRYHPKLGMSGRFVTREGGSLEPEDEARRLAAIDAHAEAAAADEAWSAQSAAAGGGGGSFEVYISERGHG